MIEEMTEAAQARVAQSINRSAGQHIRAMRESVEIDKASIIRDVICELCSLGASKKRTDTLAAQLCSLAGIDVNSLN